MSSDHELMYNSASIDQTMNIASKIKHVEKDCPLQCYLKTDYPQAFKSFNKNDGSVQIQASDITLLDQTLIYAISCTAPMSGNTLERVGCIHFSNNEQTLA